MSKSGTYRYVIEIVANNIKHMCSFFVRHAYQILSLYLKYEEKEPGGGAIDYCQSAEFRVSTIARC